MRNMTFSGKGLVKNPGNPESIIFKEQDSVIFTGLADARPKINLLVTSSNKGESSMSDNNEQVRSLQAQVETLEARLRELDEEKVQAQISAFEKACADKDAEIAELGSKLEAANEVLEASKKSFAELDAVKAESEIKITELTEKLNSIEAENLKTSRVSALVDKGIDKEESEELVETFAGITDEQFETLVLKLTEAPHKPMHDDDEEKKKKKDEKTEAPHYPFHKDKDDEKKKAKSMMKKKYAEKAEEHDAEDAAEAADEAADAEILHDAEAEDAAALAVSSEDESGEVIASLNQYFTEVLGGNNNEKES